MKYFQIGWKCYTILRWSVSLTVWCNVHLGYAAWSFASWTEAGPTLLAAVSCKVGLVLERSGHPHATQNSAVNEQLVSGVITTQIIFNERKKIPGTSSNWLTRWAAIESHKTINIKCQCVFVISSRIKVKHLERVWHVTCEQKWKWDFAKLKGLPKTKPKEVTSVTLQSI